MITEPPSRIQEDLEPAFVAAPASSYSFQELAAIYNETRVDYIVPMPMNARRMELYVRNYDIDLDASVVAYNTLGHMAGIGMLGLRQDRAWATRLGVLPDQRGRQLGHFLMTSLIEQAVQHGARCVQLEVIKGNLPAHRLFQKLGFVETRELLVIRRPPGQPTLDDPTPQADVSVLSPAEVLACLGERDPGASWIDETPSLIQAGDLHGLRVSIPGGETGWLVYQKTAFQMGYLVLHTTPLADPALARALLYHLHQLNPLLDTKLENLPALEPFWPTFQELGYVESFRRIEMILPL